MRMRTVAACIVFYGSGAGTGIAQVFLGDEFRVNEVTTGVQQRGSVAAIWNPVTGQRDTFVVVWQGPDGSADGLWARRYQANGTPLGGEFRVNTFTTSFQRYPAVASSPTGHFVVAWSSYGQTSDFDSVFFQRFDSSGTPQGGETQANVYTTGGQFGPALAMTDAGDFIVSWTSNPQDGSGRGVFFRRFSASGAPQSGEFQVNVATTGDQTTPSVAVDTEGTSSRTRGGGPAQVACFAFEGQDGSGFGAYGRVWDISDPANPVALTGEVPLSQTIPGNQGAVSTAYDRRRGRWVMTWTDFSSNDVLFREVSRLGTPLVNETIVNLAQKDAFNSWVEADRGTVMLGWHERPDPGSPFDIGAREYSLGRPVDQPFLWGFGSLHPSGASFAMGDGSVRFMKGEVSGDIWARLGTSNTIYGDGFDSIPP